MTSDDYLNRPARSLYEVVMDPEMSWSTRRMAWIELLARMGPLNPPLADLKRSLEDAQE